jgi:hypothetical protein
MPPQREAGFADYNRAKLIISAGHCSFLSNGNVLEKRTQEDALKFAAQLIYVFYSIDCSPEAL